MVEKAKEGIKIDTSLKEVNARIHALKAVNPSEVFNPPTSMGILNKVASPHQLKLKKIVDKEIEPKKENGISGANDEEETGSSSNSEVTSI